MTNKGIKIIKYGVALFLVSTLLYLPGCDITDPTEGLKVILNTKERNTMVSFVILDSKTNMPIGINTNTDIKLTVTGKDSDKIIDLLNRSKTEFSVPKGHITFAIRDEITPSQSNPIEFTVVIEADGYITTSTPVSISSTKGNPFRIYMASKTDLPTGVSGKDKAQAGSVDGTGRTIGEIVLETDRDVRTNTTMQITIKPGTLITDANGTPLSGNLEASFFHFNNMDDASLQSFPGGFSAQVTNQNNQQESVYFTTGGFASIQITDQSGRRARNFDPPIEIYMEMDADTKDHSGSTVNPGSEVPIWSYNDFSGEWAFEENAVIEQGTEGNLAVNFESNHLSWWNIDWYGPACYLGTRVDILGVMGQMTGKLKRASDGTLMGWYPTRPIAGGTTFVQFYFAPYSLPAIFELYDINNNLVGSTQISDLCTVQQAEINLTGTTEVNFTFMGVGVCATNPDVELRPSFPVWIRPSGQNVAPTYAGLLQQGQISISIPAPGMYLVGTYFEGNYYEYEVDLTNIVDGQVINEEIELPQNICDEL